MAPVLPIVSVVRPAVLAGQANGLLPASILVDTPGLKGGPVVRLVEPAARAWRALTAAAAAAGHVLKATSAVDSFRPYSVQETIFRARYTTVYLEGRPYRTWLGVRWYQRPGTAAAAVPGTSNHGWALAVDVGEERDGDLATESLDADTLGWLLDNAARFGWSWELQSEPWHLRYVTGDTIPPAVLDHEAGTSTDQEVDEMLLPEQAEQLAQTDYAVRQLILPAVARLELAVFDLGHRAGIDVDALADGLAARLGPALAAQVDGLTEAEAVEAVKVALREGVAP